MESKSSGSLIAAFGLAFSLIGCGGSDEADETAAPDDTTVDPMDPSVTDPTTEPDPPEVDPREGMPGPGTCPELGTSFVGDEACMAPPDPALGFQVHIGPSDYDDPDQVAMFTMAPGGESSECWMSKTANDADVYYQRSELSGRPGTHHIINTLLATPRADGWSGCESFVGSTERIGSLGGASRAHMPLPDIAPENEGVGTPLAAATQLQSDMHYFNVTDAPILREYWMNVYYIDEADVTETPEGIMGLGGIEWLGRPIAPGTHQSYRYEMPVPGDGRIITLLGHTHAHAIRETAWIVSGGVETKVFEQYDYLEPQIFSYNSITENPPFSATLPGALTGQLLVSAGDRLVWECEVLNDSSVGLRYINSVDQGEMCNIWGTSVGTGPIRSH